MKRRTFLNFPHTSDCCELNAVVVERQSPIYTGMKCKDEECDICNPRYRLLSHPSTCKCGHPIHLAEPTQQELKDAWDLEEAEDVE